MFKSNSMLYCKIYITRAIHTHTHTHTQTNIHLYNFKLIASLFIIFYSLFHSLYLSQSYKMFALKRYFFSFILSKVRQKYPLSPDSLGTLRQVKYKDNCGFPTMLFFIRLKRKFEYKPLG